ncbi:maleylpyruvate isomerase family mycothiol-dependent enzyme [Mycobacterium cookii]|uniref:Maleylpyruvate isomerase family mycothiol-dependent enzyme n=1 Tax=Nocardioides furvisabuli TaxID=375542 RepID=A0ABN2XB72_9ACTN|nr:maleylpyruvate isomerase family mycothiol-dependent enzyme [Nocardioides furvisabuli]
MTDFAARAADLITDADRALVRTVDGLGDAAYAEPSLLPGWSRAHVVAHLALNAEALAGVLRGAHVGTPQPMYASAQHRDSDIEHLAAQPAQALRDRLLASTTEFEQAMRAMHDNDWDGRFERAPDGPDFAVATIPLMRVREVEIHHADLDAGYTAADWSEDFVVLLLESMTRRPYPTPFTVLATDLDRSWHYGERGPGAPDEPLVIGGAAALAWWLTGRGSGEGVTCEAGALPRVESW